MSLQSLTWRDMPSALEGTHFLISLPNSIPTMSSSDHGSAVKSESSAPPPREGREYCAPLQASAAMALSLALLRLHPGTFLAQRPSWPHKPPQPCRCRHSPLQALFLLAPEKHCRSLSLTPVCVLRIHHLCLPPDPSGIPRPRFMRTDGLQALYNPSRPQLLHLQCSS